MKVRNLLLVCVGVAALAAPIAGHAEAGPWPQTKAFTLGATVHVDQGTPVGSVDEAAGPVDCANSLGGACFDTTGHVGQFFRLTASCTACASTDGSGVSIFAGFDVDGDGQVCTNNNSAIGPEHDLCFEGTGSLDGFVPQGLKDPTLYVFVRAVSVEDGGATLSPTGSLTIAACDATTQCEPNKFRGGDACVGTPTGVPNDCANLPYPYPHG